MGGYIITTRTQFIHKEDKCPNHCPSNQDGTCSSYNASTKEISTCDGHRNVDDSKTLELAAYGPGDVIQHEHENKLRSAIRTEISERIKHVWYQSKSGVHNPGGSSVAKGRLIEHSQENVINKCIADLNGYINSISDYKYAKDGSVKSHEVRAGDVISAENLKYLERNTLASYRDCICYSDCTAHGLSTWIEYVWCTYHGSTGGY